MATLEPTRMLQRNSEPAKFLVRKYAVTLLQRNERNVTYPVTLVHNSPHLFGLDSGGEHDPSVDQFPKRTHVSYISLDDAKELSSSMTREQSQHRSECADITRG